MRMSMRLHLETRAPPIWSKRMCMTYDSGRRGPPKDQVETAYAREYASAYEHEYANG